MRARNLPYTNAITSGLSSCVALLVHWHSRGASDPSESCFARSLSFGARWLGSPPGGAREGTLSCRHRGCTCQSFEATIQFLYWLLWHLSL